MKKPEKPINCLNRVERAQRWSTISGFICSLMAEHRSQCGFRSCPTERTTLPSALKALDELAKGIHLP